MKFAVIMPWPGVKNAEYEFIKRLQIASEAIGYQCHVIDNAGHLLRDITHPRPYCINGQEYDFILSLHHESPKLVDGFYYGALWNPPEYVYEQDAAVTFINHMRMYDDLLTARSERIASYLTAAFGNCPVTNQDYAEFYPALPKEAVREPDIPEDFRIFYCGINWERCTNSKGRHHGFFRALDRAGLIKIYGPEKFLNVRPWEGFESYSGSIPFDGVSITREINRCGVCLVMSSDVHRKAGMATNRLYEAMAAGALVIADENPFVRELLGDNALYVTYDKYDSSIMLEEVYAHMEWIKHHREEALEKAQNAQQIFLDGRTLDDQLLRLGRAHAKRREIVAETRYSGRENEPVDIILRQLNDDLVAFERSLQSVTAQSYPALRVIILGDTRLKEELAARAGKILGDEVPFEVVGLPLIYAALAEHDEDYLRLLPGEMINAARPYLKADYIAVLDTGVIWFGDHLTTLKRCLENDDAVGLAYSGTFNHENGSRRTTRHYETISAREIFRRQLRIPASSLMFRRTTLDAVPTGLMDYMSDYDGSALAAFSDAAGGIAFSARVTCGTDIKRELHPEHFRTYRQLRLLQQTLNTPHLTINEGAGGLTEEQFRILIKEYFARRLGRHKWLYKPAQWLYQKFLL